MRLFRKAAQRLRQFCFPLLNPADVAKPRRMGTWEHIEAGTAGATTYRIELIQMMENAGPKFTEPNVNRRT